MNALLAMVKCVVEWPLARSQRRLVKERIPISEAMFLAHFQRAGIDGGVAAAAWRVLRSEALVDGFTRAPEDDLEQVFKIAEEDLDDMVLALLRECQCRIPPPGETDAMAPVRTVEDLVRFVAEMRL
jgi:hypothetical protein